MFIESEKHIYYNTRYIEKYYRAVNEIHAVMHGGEDVLLYTLKNYEEVSIAMSVLNHLMRNDSSVVTYSDFCNQIRKVIET